MNKGQIQIAMITGIASLVAAIGVPIFWISDLRASNMVQDNKIVVLEKDKEEMKTDIKEIRKGMTALLIKQGINPDKLKND